MADETDDSTRQALADEKSIRERAIGLGVDETILDEVVNKAMDKVAERRREGKPVNISKQVRSATTAARKKKKNASRNHAADVEALSGSFASLELSEDARLKIETARHLKKKYTKLCGVEWSEGQSDFLRRILRTSQVDGRHEVEKSAVATAIKLKEALNEIQRLAEDEGGLVWSLLVHRLAPIMQNQSFTALLETTDAELKELVVDDAGLADRKARFAANYYTHRAIEKYLAADPSELANYRKLMRGGDFGQATIKVTVNPGELNRLPHDVGPTELAIVWLLAGLREDEVGGIMVPIAWDTWPTGEVRSPEDAIRKTKDSWKSGSGPGAKKQADAARARWHELGGTKI